MSALRSQTKPFTASKTGSRRISSLVLSKPVLGHRHAHVASHITKVQTTEDRIATQTIDDLDRDYCDDFQCTSSPAVEQTVRAFARDCTRLKYTTSLFNKDCTYAVSTKETEFKQYKHGSLLSMHSVQHSWCTELCSVLCALRVFVG